MATAIDISTHADAKRIDRDILSRRAVKPLATAERARPVQPPVLSPAVAQAQRIARAPVAATPAPGLRAHAIPQRELAAVVAPNGHVTTQRSQKDILAEVKEQRAQFSALAQRWGRGNDRDRAELRMAMDPVVKRENALRREFVAAAPARQLEFSFGR